VVVRLGIAGAGVLVVGDLPMGFLGQWWCVAAEGEDEFCAVAVVGIEVVEFENVVKMGVVRLLERRILPLLLLAKDFNVVLELCKSCSLSLLMCCLLAWAH
jgi:hypothetical protein